MNQFYTIADNGDTVQVDANLAKQLVASGKKKPGDFITIDGNDNTSSTTEPAPASLSSSSSSNDSDNSAGVQTTGGNTPSYHASGPATSQSAMMPDVDPSKPIYNQLPNAAYDVASSPLRLGLAGIVGATNSDDTYQSIMQNMQDGYQDKLGNEAADIITNPITYAGGAVEKGLGSIVSEVAPKLAKLFAPSSSVIKNIATNGVKGALSGANYSVENDLVNPDESQNVGEGAGIGAGAGALLTLAGGGLGNVGKFLARNSTGLNDDEINTLLNFTKDDPLFGQESPNLIPKTAMSLNPIKKNIDFEIAQAQKSQERASGKLADHTSLSIDPYSSIIPPIDNDLKNTYLVENRDKASYDEAQNYLLDRITSILDASKSPDKTGEYLDFQDANLAKNDALNKSLNGIDPVKQDIDQQISDLISQKLTNYSNEQDFLDKIAPSGGRSYDVANYSNAQDVLDKLAPIQQKLNNTSAKKVSLNDVLGLIAAAGVHSAGGNIGGLAGKVFETAGIGGGTGIGGMIASKFPGVGSTLYSASKPINNSIPWLQDFLTNIGGQATSTKE